MTTSLAIESIKITTRDSMTRSIYHPKPIKTNTGYRLKSLREMYYCVTKQDNDFLKKALIDQILEKNQKATAASLKFPEV